MGGRLTIAQYLLEARQRPGLIRNEVKEGKVVQVRFKFQDRHIFGNRLGMAGVDLKTIMDIMGHKSHRVAMKYQRPGGIIS